MSKRGRKRSLRKSHRKSRRSRRRYSRHRRRRRRSYGIYVPKYYGDPTWKPSWSGMTSSKTCGVGPYYFGRAPVNYVGNNIPTPGGFVWENSPLQRALNA